MMAIDDERAMHEAAAAGIRGMASLIAHLSCADGGSGRGSAIDYREIADATVSKFRKVISILNRTGHARFRRGPTAPSTSPEENFVPPPAAPPKPVTLDFTKPPAPPKKAGQCFSAISTSGNSSLLSSLTADGSVSNGRHTIIPPAAPPAGFSSRKPPPSSASAPLAKRKCPDHSHAHSENVGGVNTTGRCHCSKRSRKSSLKRTIRVPAVSSKVADIPSDEYSWRKYGQKPIKGSPYPRGYYKCSTLRGCPAQKHVERAPDDPSMLIVTYKGEHSHNTAAAAAPTSTAPAIPPAI